MAPDFKHDVRGLIDEYLYYGKADKYRDILEPRISGIFHSAARR